MYRALLPTPVDGWSICHAEHYCERLSTARGTGPSRGQAYISGRSAIINNRLSNVSWSQVAHLSHGVSHWTESYAVAMGGVTRLRTLLRALVTFSRQFSLYTRTLASRLDDCMYIIRIHTSAGRIKSTLPTKLCSKKISGSKIQFCFAAQTNEGCWVKIFSDSGFDSKRKLQFSILTCPPAHPHCLNCLSEIHCWHLHTCTWLDTILKKLQAAIYCWMFRVHMRRWHMLCCLMPVFN